MSSVKSFDMEYFHFTRELTDKSMMGKSLSILIFCAVFYIAIMPGFCFALEETSTYLFETRYEQLSQSEIFKAANLTYKSSYYEIGVLQSDQFASANTRLFASSYFKTFQHTISRIEATAMAHFQGIKFQPNIDISYLAENNSFHQPIFWGLRTFQYDTSESYQGRLGTTYEMNDQNSLAIHLFFGATNFRSLQDYKSTGAVLLKYNFPVQKLDCFISIASGKEPVFNSTIISVVDSLNLTLGSKLKYSKDQSYFLELTHENWNSQARSQGFNFKIETSAW